MKSTELRIGNLVRDFTDHCNINILAEDLTNTKNFQPIPLTEDWLLKFGFEKEFDYWCHSAEYFEIAETTEGNWCNSINGYEYRNGNNFQHVHQLQNLYHALTGEELTIKQ